MKLHSRIESSVWTSVYATSFVEQSVEHDPWPPNAIAATAAELADIAVRALRSLDPDDAPEVSA